MMEDAYAVELQNKIRLVTTTYEGYTSGLFDRYTELLPEFENELSVYHIYLEGIELVESAEDYTEYHNSVMIAVRESGMDSAAEQRMIAALSTGGASYGLWVR